MNAPTPWDVSPPADYPRRNVVPLHRGYVRPIDAHRTARTLNDAEMIAAIEARLNDPSNWRDGVPPSVRRPENLARFYRANPQFGRCSAGEGGLAPARPPLWQVVVAVAFVYALLLAAMVVL